MNDPSWESLILADQPPDAAWRAIFARLRDAALAAANPAALHRETIAPDRLLAESAWDLWQHFPTAAPSVVDGLREFWASSAWGGGVAGTAILILDALSLRELPLIVTAAKKRGVNPVRCEVRGSRVPTETDQFAQALGLQSRSKLFNNQPPSSFLFCGPDTHCDVIDAPFADCVAAVSSKPRLFLWHKWPDEPLIHLHADKVEGDTIVAAEVKKQLASDGLWQFIDRLRQGRRLVITGDHGYATTKEFYHEYVGEAAQPFAGAFGAQRAIREDPATPWPRRHLPPPVLRFGDGPNPWLVVVGQRKWKVRGGFPTLCHRGLSLLEAAVPFIELPSA
ncbi:MAG: hypothetical protein KF859_11015 [Phycisphaeraceae bacterium]|nr:hypothetical protein [Phycisphaeraceae bacterium]